MKHIGYTFSVICLMLMSGCDFIKKSSGQSITIKKTDSKFQFKASFPEYKTGKVYDYIEEVLLNTHIFAGNNDIKNVALNLGDTLRFRLKAEPGDVEIMMHKPDNTEIHARQIELSQFVHW